jgi:hypothetical protein
MIPGQRDSPWRHEVADRRDVEPVGHYLQHQPAEERNADSTPNESLDGEVVVGSPYNGHRPHRSLCQRPPVAKPPPMDEPAPSNEPLQLDCLRRRDRLGGLLHEYELAA